MMLWSKFIQPRLISFACATKPFMIQRIKIVPLAKGTVLEIGIGSGLNIPLYDENHVKKVVGVDPSEDMQALAKDRINESPIDIQLVVADAAKIPLDDQSIDTIVCTYTLCTVSNPEGVLKEMKRILKPGGKFLFSEHGHAPDESVNKFQLRLEPFWKFLADGCHLTRSIPELLRANGMKLDKMETMYLPSTPRFVGFNYWGSAVHDL
ncbi:class I SAM-dependent methyltransferase [bacterium]|nr:MAG: class I SAM-dependent methyltransferase [bacterium]